MQILEQLNFLVCLDQPNAKRWFQFDIYPNKIDVFTWNYEIVAEIRCVEHGLATKEIVYAHDVLTNYPICVVNDFDCLLKPKKSLFISVSLFRCSFDFRELCEWDTN